MNQYLSIYFKQTLPPKSYTRISKGRSPETKKEPETITMVGVAA